MMNKENKFLINRYILFGAIGFILFFSMLGNLFADSSEAFGLKIDSMVLAKDGNIEMSLTRANDIPVKEITCVYVHTDAKVDKLKLDKVMSEYMYTKNDVSVLSKGVNSYKFKGLQRVITAKFPDILTNYSFDKFSSTLSDDIIKNYKIANKQIENNDLKYVYTYCVSHLDDSKADWMGHTISSSKSLVDKLDQIKKKGQKFKTYNIGFWNSKDMFRSREYMFEEPNLESASYFFDIGEANEKVKKAKAAEEAARKAKEAEEAARKAKEAEEAAKKAKEKKKIYKDIKDLTLELKEVKINNKESKDYVCTDHACYFKMSDSGNNNVNLSFLVENITSKTVYLTSSKYLAGDSYSKFLKDSVFNLPVKAEEISGNIFEIGDHLLNSSDIIESDSSIFFKGKLDSTYLITIADYNKANDQKKADFSGLIDGQGLQEITENNFLQDPNYELDYYYLVPVDDANYSKLLLYLSNKKILNSFCENCLPDWSVPVSLEPRNNSTNGNKNYLNFLIENFDVFSLNTDTHAPGTSNFGVSYAGKTYEYILWDLISKKYTEFLVPFTIDNAEIIFEVGKEFDFSDEEMAQFWGIVTQESGYFSSIFNNVDPSYGYGQINYKAWCSEDKKRKSGFTQLKDYFPTSLNINKQNDYDKLCENIEKNGDQKYSLQFGAAFYRYLKNNVISKGGFLDDAFKNYDDTDSINVMFAMGYKYNLPSKNITAEKYYEISDGADQDNYILSFDPTYQAIMKVAYYLVYKKVLYDIKSLEEKELEDNAKTIKDNYSLFKDELPYIPFLDNISNNGITKINEIENKEQNN